MSAKKIHIDPMVPHYRMGRSDYNSKGGKSSHGSNDKNGALVKNHNGQLEKQDNEAIELNPVKEPHEYTQYGHMPDLMKEAEKEGVQEAMKETIKENRKNTFKFFGLMNKSERLVFRLKNIIPILTGEVVIDTAKITFIHRPFILSERIHSISVRDISDVYVDTAPFFGTLSVVDTNFAENRAIVRMNWLWKREAEKARRIITGLMAAAKEEVDLKNIEDEGLDEKLEEIGRLREVKTSVSKA